MEHFDDVIEFVIDVHNDMRHEAARLLKGVREVEDHGTVSQMRHVGTYGGNGQQIRSVLDQQSRESMIRVIVGRPVRDDQIGSEGPDVADHLMAVFQTVVKLAVGMIEHLVARRR